MRSMTSQSYMRMLAHKIIHIEYIKKRPWSSFAEPDFVDFGEGGEGVRSTSLPFTTLPCMHIVPYVVSLMQ